jgi:hypothetical protein
MVSSYTKKKLFTATVIIKQKGAAYIELIGVLPIILMIGYYGIDLQRFFFVNETLSSIARESAKMTIKNCMASLDSAQCIRENVYLKVKPLLEHSFHNAEVIISLYSLKPGSVEELERVAVDGVIVKVNDQGLEEEVTETLNAKSSFSVDKVTEFFLSEENGIILTPEKPSIAIAEIFYRYNTVTPVLYLSGLDKRVKDGLLYEIGIY